PNNRTRRLTAKSTNRGLQKRKSLRSHTNHRKEKFDKTESGHHIQQPLRVPSVFLEKTPLLEHIQVGFNTQSSHKIQRSGSLFSLCSGAFGAFTCFCRADRSGSHQFRL